MEDFDRPADWRTATLARISYLYKYRSNVNRTEKGPGRKHVILIFGFTLRTLLVILFLLLYFFHHLALAITMHFWLSLVFAILCKGSGIQIIIQADELPAEGLHQEHQDEYACCDWP
jgi:uncharacterized membrane protein